MYYKCKVLAVKNIKDINLYSNKISYSENIQSNKSFECKPQFAYRNKNIVENKLYSNNSYDILFHENSLKRLFEYKETLNLLMPSSTIESENDNSVLKVYCDGSYWNKLILNTREQKAKEYLFDQITSSACSIFENNKQVFKAVYSITDVDLNNNFAEIKAAFVALDFISKNYTNKNIIIFTDSYLLYNNLLIGDFSSIQENPNFVKTNNRNIIELVDQFVNMYNLLRRSFNIYTTLLKSHTKSQECRDIDYVRHNDVDQSCHHILDVNKQFNQQRKEIIYANTNTRSYKSRKK